MMMKKYLPQKINELVKKGDVIVERDVYRKRVHIFIEISFQSSVCSII